MCDISVIIPVFNVEQYVSECLDSVIGQKNVNLEILCVEDASQDHSLEILKYYAQKDKRIHILVNDRNRGLSYTRNRGLLNAKGKYVIFVDSDDMLKGNILSELYVYAEQSCLEGIVFDREEKIEGRLAKEKYENKGEPLNKYITEQIMDGKKLFVEFSKYGNWRIEAWRYLWKREFLMEKKLLFYEGLLHEDNLFTFLCLMNTSRIVYLNKICYIYRRRDNSITSQVCYQHVESLFIIFIEIYNYWKNNPLDERTSGAVRLYMDIIYYKFLREKEYFSEFQPLTLGVSADKFLFSKIYRKKEFKYAFLKEDKIEKIKQAKKLIVYGAGAVGLEVIELLQENSIPIDAIAVTDKRNNADHIKGYVIYEIKELQSWKQTATVIVAVVERHYESIVRKLKELGFKNLVFLDKRSEKS